MESESIKPLDLIIRNILNVCNDAARKIKIVTFIKKILKKLKGNFQILKQIWEFDVYQIQHHRDFVSKKSTVKKKFLNKKIKRGVLGKFANLKEVLFF